MLLLMFVHFISFLLYANCAINFTIIMNIFQFVFYYHHELCFAYCSLNASRWPFISMMLGSGQCFFCTGAVSEESRHDKYSIRVGEKKWFKEKKSGLKIKGDHTNLPL